jgi:hypothetical protein
VAPNCAAGASAQHVAMAAVEALSRGNAVDAVVAGILVAAAESPTVFLGPVQLLVGGAGAGLRAVDGRVRQPGLGVPRPRGLRVAEPVPAAALVGVPALPAATALVLASLGSATPLRLSGPAIERARAHSAERSRVLESFARRGASWLAEEEVVSELTAAAGRAAGGLLTRKDLASVRPAIVAFDERSLDPPGILTTPWKGDALCDASYTHIVAALDARGLAAIACYEDRVDGLAVPALGLVAPSCATPVMRGETRVRPGEPRPAAAPIALRTVGGVADFAIGLAEAGDAEASLAAVVRALGEARSMGAVVAAAKNGRPVAVARTAQGTRTLSSD